MLLSSVSYCQVYNKSHLFLCAWLFITYCVIHKASKAELTPQYEYYLCIVVVLIHRNVITALPFLFPCFQLHIMSSFVLHSREQLAKLHISQSHSNLFFLPFFLLFVFTMISTLAEAVIPTSKTTYDLLQPHIWVETMSSLSMRWHKNKKQLKWNLLMQIIIMFSSFIWQIWMKYFFLVIITHCECVISGIFKACEPNLTVRWCYF